MLSPLTREHCIYLRLPQFKDRDLLLGMCCLLQHAVLEAPQLRGETVVNTQLHCQLSLLLSDTPLQGMSVVGQPRNCCQKTAWSDEGLATAVSNCTPMHFSANTPRSADGVRILLPSSSINLTPSA